MGGVETHRQSLPREERSHTLSPAGGSRAQGREQAVDGRWDGWEGRGVRCVGYRLKNVQRHRIFDDGSCILPV